MHSTHGQLPVAFDSSLSSTMNVDVAAYHSQNDCGFLSSVPSLPKGGDGVHHLTCGCASAYKTKRLLANLRHYSIGRRTGSNCLPRYLEFAIDAEAADETPSLPFRNCFGFLAFTGFPSCPLKIVGCAECWRGRLAVKKLPSGHCANPVEASSQTWIRL